MKPGRSEMLALSNFTLYCNITVERYLLTDIELSLNPRISICLPNGSAALASNSNAMLLSLATFKLQVTIPGRLMNENSIFKVRINFTKRPANL